MQLHAHQRPPVAGSSGSRNSGAAVRPRAAAALTVRPRAAAVGAPAPAAAASEDAAALTARVVADEAKYVLGTYARPSDVVFVRGDGARLYDAAGRAYLDFAAGIAVNALGHGDARWRAALEAQAGVLTHTSNLFHTLPQVELARRLVERSFADKVFFCNSGTEANEAAIKFARKHARVAAGVDPYDANATAPTEIVSFTNCFHGRTMVRRCCCCCCCCCLGAGLLLGAAEFW